MYDAEQKHLCNLKYYLYVNGYSYLSEKERRLSFMNICFLNSLEFLCPQLIAIVAV